MLSRASSLMRAKIAYVELDTLMCSQLLQILLLTLDACLCALQFITCGEAVALVLLLHLSGMSLQRMLLLRQGVLYVIALAGKQLAVVLVELILAHECVQFHISYLQTDGLLAACCLLCGFLGILRAAAHGSHQGQACKPKGKSLHLHIVFLL